MCQQSLILYGWLCRNLRDPLPRFPHVRAGVPFDLKSSASILGAMPSITQPIHVSCRGCSIHTGQVRTQSNCAMYFTRGSRRGHPRASV